MAKGDKTYTRADGTKVVKGKDGKLKGSVAAPKKSRTNAGNTYPEYAKEPTQTLAAPMRVPTVKKTFNTFLVLVKSGKFPQLNAYLKGNKLFNKTASTRH